MQNISESLFFIPPTIKSYYAPVFCQKVITVMMLLYFLIVIPKYTFLKMFTSFVKTLYSVQCFIISLHSTKKWLLLRNQLITEAPPSPPVFAAPSALSCASNDVLSVCKVLHSFCSCASWRVANASSPSLCCLSAAISSSAWWLFSQRCFHDDVSFSSLQIFLDICNKTTAMKVYSMGHRIINMSS